MVLIFQFNFDILVDVTSILSNSNYGKSNGHSRLTTNCIKPDLTKDMPLTASGRRSETVLNRLLIGHTVLTHSYILRQEIRPKCFACDRFLSVKHILVECTGLRAIMENILMPVL